MNSAAYLFQNFKKKDPVALGKALKEAENQTEIGYELLKQTSQHKGNTFIIGITGPPGAGKSTLVTHICKEMANEGLSVGIVCVDPSSPFTGGALLGDRIRMMEIASLPNVFIKSVATRGGLGGLSATTADIVQLFDAFGKDVVIVETVGVGQIEFDVLEIADTVILVSVPGLGDSIQTFKAGIMEIADIYVINQADRPGADESVRDLQIMIRESEKKGWIPVVQKTVATEKRGIKELVSSIQEHRSYLRDSKLWEQKRVERNMKRLKDELIKKFNDELQSYTESNSELKELINKVKNGEKDPFTMTDKIFEKLIKIK